MPGKQNQSIYLKGLKQKSLATISLFAKNEMIMGIPAKVFMMGIGYVSTLMFFVSAIVGIAFGVVFYYGMLTIHQNDPKGFDIWRHVLRRLLRNKLTRWSMGKTRATYLAVI